VAHGLPPSTIGGEAAAQGQWGAAASNSAGGYFIPKRIKSTSIKSGSAPPDIDWKAVGRRIRELRGFDVTQAEFARRVGISQNHLSVVERGGREIGAAIVLRIAREFRKSMEWLLTGKD
jgi:DNA-binding XRE family transcriptional regulator